MKKAKKLILFIMIVVILIVITISIVIVNNKYNMQHYFDDWKPETDVNILHTIGRGYVEGMDLGKYINGRIEEVYCIKNKRIYFCYSTAVPDSYPNREWHIASVGITGEDFTEHYGGNLFSGSNPVGYSYEYLCLSYQSSPNIGQYGGFYADHKIYLHGDRTTVVYDTQNGILSETDRYPVSPYVWSINEHKNVVIENREQNITRNLTLESMAEQNLYAKELLNLSTKKTWDGTSLTEDIFSKLKIVDDRIYIVCEVLNWNGESFAVVFLYDFASENVLYVSSQKVGDRVDSNYSFSEYVD